VLVLLLAGIGVWVLATYVRPTGPIYIRANGSIEPSTALISTSDKITYTLTGDISNSIVLQRDNIVFDGDGNTLQGAESGSGISATSIDNVTIENTTVIGFRYGIWLGSSSNDTVSRNNIIGNAYDGLYLNSSSYNIMSNNGIFGNSNSTYQGSYPVNNYDGIELVFSSYNNVLGNSIAGNFGNSVLLDSNSSYNTLSGNSIIGNHGEGILLLYSFNNLMSDNNVIGNFGDDFNIIAGSSNNTVSGNSVIGTNGTGIYLGLALYNIVSDNDVSENTVGISLGTSSNNTIYHNDFMDNTYQTSIFYSEPNSWDNGYPSGGNYWSNYNGTDFYSGPHQNETGSDGIGDTPYIIDANNTDEYPLMKPLVPFVGDLNLDSRVDIFAIKMAACLGSRPGASRWNDQADYTRARAINLSFGPFKMCLLGRHLSF
jgi:parallel beta-helix repeat protein